MLVAACPLQALPSPSEAEAVEAAGQQGPWACPSSPLPHRQSPCPEHPQGT